MKKKNHCTDCTGGLFFYNRKYQQNACKVELNSQCSLVTLSGYSYVNWSFIIIQKLEVFSAGVLLSSGSLNLTLSAISAAGDLHYAMLESCLHANINFFSVTPIGRMINRFAKDIDTIDNSLPRFLETWLKCAVQVFGTAVVIAYSTPYCLILALPLGIFYYVVQVYIILMLKDGWHRTQVWS